MRLLTAITFSTLFLASTASAATYYVATTGNDTASGSIATPFRTLKQASRIVTAGDIVNVRGGTYSESTIISSKGTASARITFRAMPGETAILDGGSIPAGTPIVSLNGTDYVDFSGFEVRNSLNIGIVLWHAHNTRVLGNHVHHTTRNGIYAGGDAMGACSDITVSDNNVHDTVQENQYHTMTTGGWAGAVVVSKTERATITRNRIYNNDGEGLIALRTNNALIQDNEISDNFSAYLYLDNARFATIDRNLLYSTGNTRYYRDGRPGAGLAIANETKDVMNPSSDNVFTNNIVVGTRWGFYYGNYESGGGLKNTKVLNNTFYGTTDEILRVDTDTHANTVIQNNIFYSTGPGTPRYTGAGAGVSYSNNLWYGVTAGTAAGTNDVVADPNFTNPGGRTAGDYKIRVGSGAVAKALNVASIVTLDHFGAQRVNPSDIGAHQLGTAAADTIAPGIPTGVRATAGNTNSVTLTWDASSDNVGVTAYVVVRNGAIVANVGAATWTDTAVTASTLYAYQVQAVDAAGNRSALSPALSIAWSAAEATAPGTPVLNGSASSSSMIALSWHAAGNASTTRYRIYRDGTLTGVTSKSTFEDPQLTASTTYTYTVEAMDAAGNVSARSNAVTVTTLAASKGRSVRR